MFSDIEELSREVEEFRFNMQETKEISKTLKMISEQINKSKLELDAKYESFLEQISRYNTHTETLNKDLMENNIEIFNKQKDKMEDEISRATDKITDQQLVFKNGVDNIMLKLENLQLGALLSAINKVNQKINVVYIILGAIMVLNIVFMILK